MEPTSGTNKENSHERYLIIPECRATVSVPDVNLYLRSRWSTIRESTRANRHYEGSLIFRGYNREVRVRGVRDHGFIGTSQRTRDICSRTADALTNKSLSLSLRARDRTTPHACVHRRVREPGKVKTSRTSVRKFVHRRICWLHVAATTGTLSERCCNTCANNRFCCRRDYARKALLSTMINICETRFDVKRVHHNTFFIVICIAESRSEMINKYF